MPGAAYRHMRVPRRLNPAEYLRTLEAGVARHLHEGEDARLVVPGLTARPLVRTPRLGALTNHRILFLSPTPDCGLLLALHLSEMAVREPSVYGITVQLGGDSRIVKLNAGDELNRLFGRLVYEGVLGPAHAAGGSPTDEAAIGACVFLGGHGLPLAIGSSYVLVFRDQSLLIRNPEAGELVRIPIEQIHDLNFSGPGAYQTGGGFIGGGFGLEAAAKGIALSSVLNALTTRRKVKSVVRMETADTVGYFEHNVKAPEELRIDLSRYIHQIRRPPPSMPFSSQDPLDQLAKLAELHSQGALSDDEFATGKARLLDSL